MNCYRILLSSDQILSGAQIRIMDAFLAAFTRAGGPSGMALLAGDWIYKDPQDDGALPVLFSPDSVLGCKAILANYSAEPCDTPKRASSQLLIGRQSAWQLLK